jgi:D-glycero-beta-D-manno-heptose 1-phosphate adenylyltransferase
VKIKNTTRVIARDELSVLRDRHQGASIGLCNGAFDLFHVGHLRYLQDAANISDILVVAVNSDVSVQSSKGPQRPIVPQGERLELLSALNMIDYIYLFDEKNVEKVLRTLKPDFHIKGTDYTPETVPEAALVKSLGGKVVIAGDPKDHATTDILKKIKESQS